MCIYLIVIMFNSYQCCLEAALMCNAIWLDLQQDRTQGRLVRRKMGVMEEKSPSEEEEYKNQAEEEDKNQAIC
jgi:hypothetical protein